MSSRSPAPPSRVQGPSRLAQPLLHRRRWQLAVEPRAKELGHDNILRFLKANLKEEKAADKKLNMLAEAKLNRKATGTRVAAARVTVKKRTGKATRSKAASRKK